MDKKEFKLVADGLQLTAAIYTPAGKGPYPALAICHGIPAQVYDPQDRGYPLLAERFCAQGFQTLIFNFRGCGESEGNFDVLAWTRDLDSAINYLSNLDSVDKSRLFLMGFSGGAATSIYCAARDRRVTAVVSCACPARFNMMTDMDRMKSLIAQSRRTGIIRDPEFPVSVDEWIRGFQEISPINWIRRISPRPVLIVHGDCDAVCPVGDAWQLYYEAKKPKDISVVIGGEHRLRTNEVAMDIALSWLKKLSISIQRQKR